MSIDEQESMFPVGGDEPAEAKDVVDSTDPSGLAASEAVQEAANADRGVQQSTPNPDDQGRLDRRDSDGSEARDGNGSPDDPPETEKRGVRLADDQTPRRLPAFAQPSPEQLPPFFLTNRYNLLDILSSGLIKPAAGFSKYYMDLLKIAPGRLPLLSTPPGSDLVGFVSQSDATAFPVALELDPEVLDLSNAPTDSSGGNVVWAPDGVIPASAVVLIHFRSEDELHEVSARRFRNLEIPVDRLVVSPEFFGPRRLDGEATIEWLGNLRSPKKLSNLALLDRLAGAWAQVVAAAPPDEDYLELAAALLVGMEKEPKPKGTEPTWVAGGRLRTLKKDRRRRLTLNDRLFEASIEALLEVDLNEEWRPVEVLDRIAEQVAPGVHDTAEGPGFVEAADYIRAVLRNETDIRPFNPDRGDPAAKALLMVLLRPEPDRVLGWLDSDIAPEYPEYVAAAALSGVLTGWSQLPIELRASHLDTTVSTRIAMEANAVASDPAWNGRRPTDFVTTAVQVGRDGEAVFLTSAGERSLFERSYRLPLTELIHRLELRSDSPALLDLANAAGWVDECIVTIVDATPREAEGGQEGTVFAGIPAIKQRVLVEALRDLVAFRGLPPGLDRLRSRLIEEHFSATKQGTGDVEAQREDDGKSRSYVQSKSLPRTREVPPTSKSS